MRKKFTLLFASLLAFVGVAKAQVTSLEQLSNDVKYVITSSRCFFIVDTDGKVLQTSTRNGSAAKFDANDENQQFKIINENDSYFLFSVGANKFVSKDGSLSETANDALTLNDESASRPNYPWKMCIGGNGLNSQISGQNDNGIIINGWTTADDGNCYAICNVEEYALSTEYYYQIRNVEYSRMLAANANKAKTVSTNSVADLEQLWAFEQGEKEGTYYLRNAGQQKYLVASASTNGAWTVAEEGGTAFNVNLQNIATLSYCLHASEQDEYGNAHDANWSGEERVVRWLASATGSQWYLEKTDISADAVKISYAYSLVYNGEVKGTQQCTGFVGEAYAEVATAGLPYGIAVTKPAGELTVDVDGTTVEVVLSDNLPFVPAADYASIKNWYYIQMHSSGGNYSRYIQAMDGYIEWLDVNMNAAEADSYTWGFVGNPFDGFKLVNYAAGQDKAVNSNGQGNPALGAYETGAQWVIAASTSNPTAEFFCFNYLGSNQYMNAQSGKVAFWGSKDQGSTMWVTERDLSGATELLALVESANAMVAALGESTGVGSVTSESLSALISEVGKAQAAADAKEGCLEAMVALQAAIDALETIQPEESVFYALKNNYTNRYMNVNSTAGLIATTGGVGIGEVFQFVKDNGNLYLKNVERGTYLSTALGHAGGQNAAGVAVIADAKAVVVKNLGKANQVSITPNGGATLHHDTNQNSIVAWNSGVDSKSSWTIEAVDITELSHIVSISDVKWETLVLGYDAIIPDGVTAYAVTEAGDEGAKLAEITGVIPANEPVLINAEAGEYGFKYAAAGAVAVESNLLKGSVFNVNVVGDIYVLNSSESGVGLYKAEKNVSTDTTNDGTEEEPAVTYEAFLSKAFEAYLPFEGENVSDMFSLVLPTPTGIANVEVQESVVIYDLLGRRVEKMEKGLYIVNGRKVLVK